MMIPEVRWAPMVAALEGSRYNATVARLIAPSPPGKKIWRSWLTYRSRFVEPKRIGWGVDFYNENRDLLNQAAQRFGVPAPIIASIIGVETLYGRQTGTFRVLDALGTLAFHYPDPARTDRVQLFRDQLADLIELDLTTHLDARTLRGSFAGAIGIPQFMPGSIRRFAVDLDKDGRIDLRNGNADAIGSVANFLAQHGWVAGKPTHYPVTIEEPVKARPFIDAGPVPLLGLGLGGVGALGSVRLVWIREGGHESEHEEQDLPEDEAPRQLRVGHGPACCHMCGCDAQR